MSKVDRIFHVKSLQILDEKGHANEKLMPKLSKTEIKKFYELMVLSRIFDEKALALQRQGRLGTYASTRGQEAAQVASAYALKKTDWLFPAFRESAAYITRGVPMHKTLVYWAGDERGNLTGVPNTFPPAVPVSTQILHAVGLGWGLKMQRKKAASLVYFGDGATSRGDFHEGLNFAGVFKIPVVFLCQNNQYAISLPRERQTAAETLAQKAIAYGFEGIQVDGNDVFAVYRATKEALEKARRGGGPTLIEAVTYRLGDHTTSDDASKYRSKAEVEKWKKRDPILRLQKYMQKKKIWSKEYETKLIKKSKELVEKEVKKMESIPAPNSNDMFQYTFATLPKDLQQQMEEYGKD